MPNARLPCDQAIRRAAAGMHSGAARRRRPLTSPGPAGLQVCRSMAGSPTLLLAALLAADPAAPATEGAASGKAPDEATEAGVAPVELIPRLELRQSFARLESGASLHITTTEIDIGFVGRVLVRYEGEIRVVSSPTAGQISGFGDA